MVQTLPNLEVLSTRAGFNAAVRHINTTIHIADIIKNHNVGDLLFDGESEGLSGEEIALLLRMLLVDKLGYQARSSNLATVAVDPAALAEEFARWSAVDLLAVYHHPELGLLAANPKDPAQLTAWGGLKKWELLVIYAGDAGKGAEGLCRKAAETALDLFAGIKTKILAELYRGNFQVKKPKKAAPAHSGTGERKRGKLPPERARKKAPPVLPTQAEPPVFTAAPAVTGPLRMTPRYSVIVRNELFHNGNVEAWKRIIDSYNTKYPELQVYIYYDGERILDINALFKWGKVKHGSSIQFSVAGNDIKDVAKLQRYLIQGASPQFEAFLRGSVSTVLRLF
ncbi:hypothetical protein LQZ21_02700 [Treponema sp. TIM-1]|uniref:hypothetical protein n=1 Tax=Treponema sp. TIM-1 TaxID=2898417 RepID=UPI00397FA487